MSQPDDPFTRHIGRWKAEQALPWVQLKYRLVAANLQKHLLWRPLCILDAGGGNGIEALEIARAGYAVTLVDSSAAMLEDARAAAAAAGLAERLAIVHGDASALQSLVPAASFDLVLCHNVRLNAAGMWAKGIEARVETLELSMPQNHHGFSYNR